MKQLVCIGCPRGCRLTVDEDNDYKVSGNHCNVGAEYGRNELINPTRVLTTTIRINGGIHNCLPVHSSKPIPKGLLVEAAKALKDVCVQSPIKNGDVVVSNILNCGVDIVASRDM